MNRKSSAVTINIEGSRIALSLDYLRGIAAPPNLFHIGIIVVPGLPVTLQITEENHMLNFPIHTIRNGKSERSN